MPSDLASRAHAILTRALGVERAQREEVVMSACAGDAELEARVRRLLKAADESDSFLDAPALTASRTTRYPGAAPLPVPDAVGTYLVVGVLGTGGMATVYEAVQENPNRRVALKVMHQTMTHTDALLRFRLEAQTLARLHHPGIAQIYEAGTAQLGQLRPSPFFAMELIPEALSITEYARRHSLPLRSRLEMFADVCDAVLHGHQNGIIHRDLKPANVLVGPDGRAKVIDFGIARSMSAGAGSGESASLTGASDARKLIGTLNAMSPEQCTDPARVDVRSDVYSLGVILYELVTDRPPHDLSEHTIPRAVQIITQESPERAGTLRREAAGDLDAIIGKAMEKDRALRYSGTDALAADIRRYLGNEPVQARAATPLELARKFARRNPPLAAALAAAVVLLVGGVVVSSRFAYIAAHARDAALQRERDLETVTAFQASMLSGIDVPAMGDRLRTSLERSVERSLTDAPDQPEAQAAVQEWSRITNRVNFTTLAVESLNQSVLARAAESINTEFAQRPLIRARLLQSLAGTMNNLGLRAQAEPVLQQALDIRLKELGPDHESTLQSQHSMGSLEMSLGRFDDAVARLKDTHERHARLSGPDDPLTLRTGTSLGGAYRRQGDLANAERVWNDTLARQRRTLGPDHRSTLGSLNNIGVLYAVQGKLDQAEAAWRELLERRRRILGDDHPDYRSVLGNLGMLLADRGRLDEARTLIEQALAADRRHHGDTHADTLVTMSQLATVLREAGDLDAAEQLQRECAAGRLAALGPDNPDTVDAQSGLAGILHLRGDIAAAETMIRAAIDAQRRLLGPSHPDTTDSLGTLRDILSACGRMGEAMDVSLGLVAAAARSTAIDPIALGKHYSEHGALLLKTGAPDQAIEPLSEAYRLLSDSIGAGHAKALEAAARLWECHDALHRMNPQGGHGAQAESWRLKSIPPP
ncbi:MAG: tetratricopeptide repeat protein [Phycisphaerales bacterium]